MLVSAYPIVSEVTIHVCRRTGPVRGRVGSVSCRCHLVIRVSVCAVRYGQRCTRAYGEPVPSGLSFIRKSQDTSGPTRWRGTRRTSRANDPQNNSGEAAAALSRGRQPTVP